MTRITLALIAACLLVGPSTAQAAQTFGSRLNHEPANGPEECGDPPVACTFVAIRQPGPTGTNAPQPAPSSGVVVKFRIRSFSADRVTFRFATVTEQGDTGLARLVGGTGPTVTFAGTGAVEEFPARVRVPKGALLALEGTSHGATYNTDGGTDAYEYAPPLVAGQGPRANTGDSGGEMLVQAVLEADADNDGFGDESQDRCPGQTGTDDTGCDKEKPRATGLKVKGRTLSVTLSEAGSITAVLHRSTKGRRVRGKCRRRTRRNAKRRKCTRRVKVKTIRAAGKAGRNKVKLPKKLKAGRYRLTLKVEDAAGNVSARKTVKFKVKKKKRRRRR